MELDPKAVVVTGAGGEIGRETALQFARHGASVAVVDVVRAAAVDTADAISAEGGNGIALCADLSEEGEVTTVVGRAAAELGGIDAVACIAGVHSGGEVSRYAADQWDRVMSLNARSCFLTCKHSAPYLVERGGGTITNMASLAALNGAAGLGGYSASKAAIVALTRVMAAELGRFQIRVNAVCPGWIDTAFNEPAITALGGASARDEMIAGSVPLGRQGSVREVADVFVFLASQASSYVTGQAIVVDGGLY